MTKYVVRTDAGEQLWHPLPDVYPDVGYLLYQDEEGRWRWLYQEAGWDDQIGPAFEHRDEALTSIADDWEEGLGYPSSGFLSTIRGQASRARFERESAKEDNR